MTDLFPPMPGEPVPLPARLHLDAHAFEHETIDVSAAVSQAVQITAQSTPAPRHPVGLNVRQDVDYAKVLAYVKLLGGVRSSLFHCDAGNLHRLHAFKEWVDVLIWRPREYNGETLYQQYGPKVYIDYAVSALQTMGFDLQRVWIHLHNEAGWSQAMIDWEHEAATYALSKGARVVLLSPAVGTPEQTALPMARKLIVLAGEHPDDIYIGGHEYFSIYGTRKDPWYLERWAFWEAYRVQEGLPGVHYVVTEFGSEDIADDHAWTSSLPRTGERKHVGPVKANDKAWQATYHTGVNVEPKPYPGLDAAYAEQITMAVDVGHYLDPRIVGLCLFTWGNRENRWVDYDVSDMSAMHSLLAKWWKDELVTIPPVVPPPVEIAWIEATLEAGTMPNGEPASIFVRPQPGAIEWVAIPKDGEPIAYKPEPVKSSSKNGVTYKWLYVRTVNSVEGWMALVMPGATPEKPGAQFVPKVVQPPVDPPPPPPDDDDDLPNDAPATIHDVDKLRVEMVMYSNGKFDALLAKIDHLTARVDAYERIMRAHHLNIENELKLAV